MLFEQQGLKPIRDWKLAFKQPGKTVVVALGDIPPINHRSFDLYRFQRRGGSVLIASDHSYHLRADLSISRGPISTFSAADKYQGHDDCIRIKNLNSSHLLAAGITELITNRTGVVRPRWSAQSKWQVIARLPDSTSRAFRGQPIIAALDRENENGSRIVAVSDHSLFTNGMIWHGDNARFAINVASFLSGKQRTQVLFLVDGIAASSYLVGPLARELPFPDTDTGGLLDLGATQMAEVANSLIEHVSDTNVINELATDQPRTLREPIFRRVLWNVLALGLFVLAATILARRGQRPSDPANRLSPRSTPSIRDKPKNNPESHGRTAATLARTFFREATESTDAAVWKELVEQNRLQSKRLELAQETKAELALILSLAVETKPGKMASTKLIHTAQAISNLRQELSESATRI